MLGRVLVACRRTNLAMRALLRDPRPLRTTPIESSPHHPPLFEESFCPTAVVVPEVVGAPCNEVLVLTALLTGGGPGAIDREFMEALVPVPISNSTTFRFCRVPGGVTFLAPWSLTYPSVASNARPSPNNRST